MNKRTMLTIAVLLMVTAPPVMAGDELAGPREWDFAVTLDGEPFGAHQFRVDEGAGAQDKWKITSKADYAYTFIGVPLFHYHHVAHEQWRGGCLSRLTADTDHDGELSHVRAFAAHNDGTVQTGNSADGTNKQTAWNGCLMSFAYWNPEMRRQTRLLNPETGEIEPVTITQEPDITISVRGQTIQAHVWRVAGKHDPIDVLYDSDDNWVGLNATVRGGRALSYRLP